MFDDSRFGGEYLVRPVALQHRPLEELAVTRAPQLPDDPHRRVRVFPQDVPHVVHRREDPRVPGDDVDELVVVHARRAPPFEVPHELPVRLVYVLLRGVAPVVPAQRLAPLGLAAKRLPPGLGETDGGHELVSREPPVVVQVEEPEREAHAPEAPGEDEGREPDYELAKVYRPVAIAVQDIHQPFQVDVLGEAEHTRKFMRVNFAVPIGIRVSEEAVRPAKAALSQRIDVVQRGETQRILRPANLRLLRDAERRHAPTHAPLACVSPF